MGACRKDKTKDCSVKGETDTSGNRLALDPLDLDISNKFDVDALLVAPNACNVETVPVAPEAHNVDALTVPSDEYNVDALDLDTFDLDNPEVMETVLGNLIDEYSNSPYISENGGDGMFPTEEVPSCSSVPPLNEGVQECTEKTDTEMIDEAYDPWNTIPGTPLDPTPKYNYLVGSDPMLSSNNEAILDLFASDLGVFSIKEEPFDKRPEPCAYDAYHPKTTVDIEWSSPWSQFMPYPNWQTDEENMQTEDEEPEKKEEVVSVNPETVLESIKSDHSYQKPGSLSPAEFPVIINKTYCTADSTRTRRMRSCRQKKSEPVSIQKAVQSYLKAQPESARKRKRVANSVATSSGSGSGSVSGYESDASLLPPAKRAKRAPSKAAARSAKPTKSEQQRIAHNLNEKMRRNQITRQINEIRSLVPINYFEDRPNARAKASKEKVIIAATACLKKMGKLTQEGIRQTLDSLRENNADLEKMMKRKIRRFLKKYSKVKGQKYQIALNDGEAFILKKLASIKRFQKYVYPKICF